MTNGTALRVEKYVAGPIQIERHWDKDPDTGQEFLSLERYTSPEGSTERQFGRSRLPATVGVAPTVAAAPAIAVPTAAPAAPAAPAGLGQIGQLASLIPHPAAQVIGAALRRNDMSSNDDTLTEIEAGLQSILGKIQKAITNSPKSNVESETYQSISPMGETLTQRTYEETPTHVRTIEVVETVKTPTQESPTAPPTQQVSPPSPAVNEEGARTEYVAESVSEATEFESDLRDFGIPGVEREGTAVRWFSQIENQPEVPGTREEQVEYDEEYGKLLSEHDSVLEQLKEEENALKDDPKFEEKFFVIKKKRVRAGKVYDKAVSALRKKFKLSLGNESIETETYVDETPEIKRETRRSWFTGKEKAPTTNAKRTIYDIFRKMRSNLTHNEFVALERWAIEEGQEQHSQHAVKALIKFIEEESKEAAHAPTYHRNEKKELGKPGRRVYHLVDAKTGDIVQLALSRREADFMKRRLERELKVPLFVREEPFLSNKSVRKNVVKHLREVSVKQLLGTRPKMKRRKKK